MAEAAFTILHGVAHFLLGHILDPALLSSAQKYFRPNSWLFISYISMICFLCLGPYLGYLNGIDRYVCLISHLVSVALFVAYVPAQFAFGAVQLFLNCWYCLPRVLFLGYVTNEAVSKRVDDGWALVSIAFLALMPVVFLEMLECDELIMPLGGHFVYDGSVLILSILYSATIWRQCGPAASLWPETSKLP
jgi:hypothetical protein